MPAIPTTLPVVPGPGPDLEVVKLWALASGQVIAGPLLHQSPCDDKRVLHQFRKKTRGYLSAQNLGSCDVQIAADGKVILDLPAVPGGHLGGSAEFWATWLVYRCAGSAAETCKFVWVVRRAP